MAKKVQIPEDIREFLGFVEAGKLFDIQEWIGAGKRVRCPELGERSGYTLECACASGFHSLVTVVLREAEWTQEEKNRALAVALENKRLDLVELLLDFGADARSADFADVGRLVNVEWMQRFMDEGCDPSAGNGFARALDDTKARPLLGFLRSNMQECPLLKSQASLALAEAVEAEKCRWAALLVWAGADPMMEVPDSLYDYCEITEYGGRVPAEMACRYGNSELVKVLKLKPTAEEMQDLLYTAVLWNFPDIVRQLIKLAPKSINAGEPPSCKAIRHFFDYDRYGFWGGSSRKERRQNSLQCLELLLEAGAKWVPEDNDINYLRRNFGKNEPRDVVRVLRLMLYVPNAISREILLEFCDTPKIRRVIYHGDSKLSDEMDDMRKRLD